MHVHMHTVCTVLGMSRDCPQKSGPRQAGEHQHGSFTHSRQFPLAGLQCWAACQPATHRSDSQCWEGALAASSCHCMGHSPALVGHKSHPLPGEMSWMKDTALSLGIWVSVFQATSLHLLGRLEGLSLPAIQCV